MNFLKPFFALIFLLSPCMVNGQQNHVFNGSFEDTIKCPTGNAQLTSSCYGWGEYQSPDYFNACNTTMVNVPNAGLGYQHAANGVAYGGLIAHMGNYFEYITQHIKPLAVGASYEVSMSVSLANISRYRTDNIGVFFFDTGYNNLSFTGVFPMSPQVNFSNHGTIGDTLGWTRLVSTFTADSAYDNIVIGGFKYTSANPIGYILDSFQTGSPYAYYYIDSVIIKNVDSLFINDTEKLLCAGDTFTVDYISTIRKNSNNIFKIQLSNSTGSFISPIDIGSLLYDTSGSIQCVIPSNTPVGHGYKIRIVASGYADTSNGYNTYKIGQSVSKPVASNNGPVCENTILQLSAVSATQNVLYKWTGPNGFTSNIQNPILSNLLPVSAGDYIVTAYLYGCESSDTTTAVVQIGYGPNAVIAGVNPLICTNDTIKLTGSSTGGNDSYSWTGPNGFSSSQNNPILANSSSALNGDYILTATDGICIGKDTVSVTVKPRPANFDAVYNAPLCSGNTLNFTASSTSGGVTYAWTGPNGFSSSSATPSISGAGSVHNGYYYVTATLNGCSLSDTVAVTVKTTPIVPTMNNNGPVCSGETITLAAASTTAGASYSWTGPNSYSSSLQNPTISSSTTNMSGTYTATATLDGCSSSATTSITVKPMPSAVTTSSNTPVCAGSNLLVSIGTSSTGSTYSWTGPNSFSSSNLSNTITAATTAATGWYVAKVALNGCSFKDSVYATVNPTPAMPTISFNSPLCVGETLNLNGGSVTGGTYSWTGPNSFSSTQNNPARSNMQWADTGLYKTIVTVNGCTSPEAQARVTMNPVPFVTILSTPMDTICNGEAVNFSAIASNHGGTPLYQWHVNGGLMSTGTTFNTNSLSDKDVIRCDMTEYTKCSVPYKDESNDITITVMPWLAPSVSITANPTAPLKPDEFITFTAKPVDGGAIPKFQWKRNGQNIVGATGAIWSANTLNDNDDICVELTSTYRCPQPLTANSNCIKVRVLTGVDDINGNNKWTVHPNPNNGRFTITATDIYSTEARLEVVNTLGQVIYRDIATTQQGNISKEVDLNDVAKGIYLLRIYAGNEINIVKLILE